MSLQGECAKSFKLEDLPLFIRCGSMEGLTTDDLDHSVHIAEYEWMSFYEESEECSLLLASIADIDSSNLSDSEECVCRQHSDVAGGQHGAQQSAAVNTSIPQTKALSLSLIDECYTSFANALQVEQRATAGQSDDLPSEEETNCVSSRENSAAGLNYPKENTNFTKQVQKEIHLITELETQTTERTLRGADSGVAIKSEKERWFITVDYSPLQQRVHKKRHRKKNTPRNVSCLGSRKPHEPSLEGKVDLVIKEDNASEGEKDMQYLTELHQTSGLHYSAVASQNHLQVEDLPESHQMCMDSPSFATGDFSQNLKMCHFNEADPQESKSILPATPEIKGQNNASLDSVLSEDFESVDEFCSARSYDSESPASAPDSVEEAWHLVKDFRAENKPVDIELSEQCTLSPTASNNQTANPSNIHNVQINSCDTENVYSTRLLEGEGCERNVDRSYTEQTRTFLPATQNSNLMPEQNSASNNETHSLISHMSLGKPHEHLQSCRLTQDQLKFPFPAVPSVTVTPCSVAGSPEAYAESFGPSRSVFAMSSFWDEMEKLTIKDILHLRMAGGPSSTDPQNIQQTAKPPGAVPDILTHTGCVDDAVEWSDGALVETSDTADSDYFTNTDDFKPDGSSCEFSTSSDFDEEYWQLTGASRDPSPDPHDNNPASQRAAVSSPTRDSWVEDTKPPGEEATVEKCFDDQSFNSLLSSQPILPRGITKTKSMHNVRALNTDIQQKETPLQSALENSYTSSLHFNSQSLEENPSKKAREPVLGTRALTPILYNADILDDSYQIPFPESFEYLFEENQPKKDSRSVALFGDMPVITPYDYIHESEGSLLSFQDSHCIEGKPVPIFSCSHASIRDLTFPEVEYLFLKEPPAEPQGEDCSVPIRVVSHAHLQVDDSVSSERAPRRALFSEKRWCPRWSSLFSMGKLRFPDSRSSWCRRSGAWVFPVDVQNTPVKGTNTVTTMFSERQFTSIPSQFFSEMAARQQLLKILQGTVPLSETEGIFSTLKHADMCLVCIAVASWVLRSTDPQATDAWKAALLANVSAISAIKYLRQYVTKDPAKDES